MTPAEKFITLKLITEYRITSFGKKEFNLAQLLTEFAEKQASFISSNPLVIKSVCPKCGSDRWIKEGDYCECTECITLFKQTVL